MILFFTFALVLVTAMVLLLLDDNLSAKKTESIRAGETIELEMQALRDATKSAWAEAMFPRINQTDALPDENKRKNIESALNEFLDKNHSFYGLKITPQIPSPMEAPSEPFIDIENKEKLRRLNNFRNCLIRRDFCGIASSRQFDLEGRKYRLQAFYTSPVSDPAINALAFRYQVYAALVIILAVALFIIMYFGTFSPMRKVIKCLGVADQRGVQLLARPRTLIERAYNHLARNSIVQQIGLSLTEWGAEPESAILVQSGEALFQVKERIIPFLEKSGVFSQVWLFHAGVSGTPFVLAGSNGTESLSLSDHGDQVELGFSGGGSARLEKTGDRNTFGNERHIASLIEVEEHHCGAVVVEKRSNASTVTVSDVKMVADLTIQIEQTLSNVTAHLLRSEKQKADISVALSTSMGHDLTNMIATSKWDIQTVQMYLSRVLPKLGEDRQAKIFGQSLQGLLSNMQLLQEVVDLYRSLGLTKKPQYEACDIVHLTEDAVNLFQFSTSRNVTLSTRHEDEVPEFFVEPRLLKVALFNLLSNAGQACANRSIQIGQSEEKYIGTIDILTRRLNQQSVAIEITDNGTGFLDKEGQKLPVEQIHRAFRSGYTTKTGRVAGGLGLSWVQTIVRDLHAGDIQAENVEPNGALFRIVLPIRQKQEIDSTTPSDH